MSLVYAWPHYLKGHQIGEIRRYTDSETGKKFDVPYYNRDNAGWLKGTDALKQPWPLMGVDDFQHIHKPLCIGEGQKVRQALAGLGYQALNCICGSNSAFISDWSICQRADKIYLFLDNDPAGEKFGQDVYQALHAYNSIPAIEIIRFDLGKGADVCDWLKQQPELSDWNELDPLDDHPAKAALRARLEDYIKLNGKQPPDDWQIDTSWQEPESIDADLSKIHRLPPAMVPAPLRGWVEDVSHRMQCPREYVAVGALVTIGAAIGGRCALRPKRHDNWAVHPNLWGIICGPPGSMKSSAMSAALQPLQILESAAAKENDAKRKDYEAAKLAYDGKLSGAKETLKKAGRSNQEQQAEIEAARQVMEGEPVAPALTRYIIHNSTMEALCPILQDNPKGVLVFQDELAGLLHTWEKEGRQQERPFYMTAWNGREPYTVDRKTSAPIRIDSATVSILGGTQPDLLKSYMVEQASGNNDGLMQRFQLAIFLTSDEAISDEIVDAEPDRHSRERFTRLVTILAQEDYLVMGAALDGEHNAAPFFRFTEPAQKFFFDWLKDLKRLIKKADNNYYRQHLDKYSKLFCALALIFQLIENSDQQIAHPAVSRDNAELAAAWCSFLAEHARRIYGLVQPEDHDAYKALAVKIKTGKLAGDFKVRDVIHRHWPGLMEKRTIEQACNELIEAKWLKRHERRGDGKGRPSVYYSINPKVLQHG